MAAAMRVARKNLPKPHSLFTAGEVAVGSQHGRVLSCGHPYNPPLVSVAVKACPTYERGQGWELFDAYGFRVDALEDGEQLHVSMLHVPFGPWQLTRAN
jgi:hypothetical protein